MRRNYSLQKVNSIRYSPNKQSKALRSRLYFPLPGDSGIYHGVGRKHFWQGYEEPNNNNNKLIRNESEKLVFRNPLNVRDIEGATPSLQPDIVKNKLRGLENLKMKSQSNTDYDSLRKLSNEYDLKRSNNYQMEVKKQIRTPKTDILSGKLRLDNNPQAYKSEVKSNNNIFSTRAYNPTYLSNALGIV